MNIFDKKPMAMLEQETALKVYFDALLQDMSHSMFTAEPQCLLQRKILEENSTLKPVMVIPELPLQPVIEKLTQASTTPAWAATSFQCLLVSVNEVKLAIPLIKLRSIVHLTEPVKLVPGYASWFIGLLPWRGTNINIIDIYKLLAMDSTEIVSLNKSIPKYVLLVGDGAWGFMCDDVSRIVTLNSDQIQWRLDRTRRSCLVGTVIEHMCSLLDTDEFVIPARIMPVNSCEDSALVF